MGGTIVYGAVKQYVVFDTETSSEDGVIPGEEHLHFRLGCARYRWVGLKGKQKAEWFHFLDAADFHAWLAEVANIHEPLWIFAHNLAFDSRIVDLFGYVDKEHYTLTPKYDAGEGKRKKNPVLLLDDPPTYLRLYRNGTHEFKWVDSFNYFQMSLERIGEAVGVPKQEVDFDTADDETLLGYCQQDVLILDKAIHGLITWCRDNAPLRMGVTGASISFNKWRLQNQKEIKPSEIGTPNRESEKKAYFGGVTRILRSGVIRQPCYHVDVNSLYPWIMKTHKFPVACRFPGTGYDDLWGLQAQDSNTCIAEVTLHAEKGPFPFRRKGQFRYEMGWMETVLCGPELTRALREERIKHVGSWYPYDFEDLFSEYIDDLWNQRKQYQEAGNDMYDLFTKICMNSLYGKFAQKYPSWTKAEQVIAADRWGQWLHFSQAEGKLIKYRAIAGYVEKQGEPEDNPRSFPAVSAFVTSHAREYMHKTARDIIGYQNVFYQATDAYFVSQSGLDNMRMAGLIGTDLGQWKIVRKADLCVFHAPGHYQHGKRVIRAGVKSKSVMIDTRHMQEILFSGMSAYVKDPLEASVTIHKQAKTVFEEVPIGEGEGS